MALGKQFGVVMCDKGKNRFETATDYIVEGVSMALSALSEKYPPGSSNVSDTSAGAVRNQLKYGLRSRPGMLLFVLICFPS